MSADEIKLLLIEDEKRDARLIQAMLGAVTAAAFQIECIDHLSAALRRLAQGGIDVVLLDLSLPDSRGLDTFTKVHKQVPGVPIVVMTGLDDAAVGTEAVKKGAQDYLIKGQTEQGLLGRSLMYAIERNRVRGELKRSEDKFKDLVELLPQSIFETDSTGKLTFVNRHGLEASGYTQADIDKGLDAIDLFVEEDRERAKGLVPGLLKGETVSSEFMARKKDGSTLPVIIHEAPIFRGKEMVGARGVVIDITDIKRNEEALRHSEEKLKELVEKLRLSQEALSTPVVQIWDNVLALPLIGIVDDRRAQHVMEVLLRNIVVTQSELVILDVTGVTAMDSQVASYVMQTARAASLLGASCILTGIQPDVAQTVIDLGLDMTKVVIKKDMREGLRWALQTMGYQLRNGGVAEAVAARR